MRIRWIGLTLGAALVLCLGVRWNRAWRFESWTRIPLPFCASIVDFDAPIQSILGYSGEGFYYVHFRGSLECIAEFQRSAIIHGCQSLGKPQGSCDVSWGTAEDDIDLRTFAPGLIEDARQQVSGARVESLRPYAALLASPETGDVWFYNRQS